MEKEGRGDVDEEKEGSEEGSGDSGKARGDEDNENSEEWKGE